MTSPFPPPPAALPDDRELLDTLHDRLVAAAGDRKLIDVGYRTVDSPVGVLLVAATDAGVVRVAFDSEGHDRVLTALADLIGRRILRDPRRLDVVARELDEYFAGRRRSFDLPVDLRLTHGFRRTVVAALPTIDYGSTASYAQVATIAGSPAAVRAVGTACATNPVPVIVPCHRVVRSDGTIGAYRGGPAAKRLLLELEAGGRVPHRAG